ncbi:MAG: tripartite tricarboxylate transporter TctB family protein [Pseudomonadota bacterium]
MADADRVTALILFTLGLAMLAGGWTMDRLEIRRIHPASIPGLVPMILGGCLALCAALLWRSASRAKASSESEPFLGGGSWSRLVTTAGICLVYALILVGWLPFFWATALFVTAFALIFSWPSEPDLRPRIRAALGAAGLGVAIAFGTSVLFQEMFLVRLP